MTAQDPASSSQPISSRWRRLSLQQRNGPNGSGSNDFMPGRRRSSISRATRNSPDSVSTADEDRGEVCDAFIGCVYGADMAYVDQFLTPDMIDLSQISLHSFRNRSCDARNFEITYYHALRYRGDIVWILETICRGDGKDIQGEVSTCSISEDGCLRVRITHKSGGGGVEMRRKSSINKNSNHSLGQDEFGGSQHSCPGANREKYMLDLGDIILRSAEAYKELSQL